MALNFDSLTVDGSGRVSFSGLSSGIDFVAAVNNIMKARRVPVDTLEKRVDQNTLRIAALGDLQSGLAKLQESLSRLYGAVSFGNSRNIFESKNAFTSASRSDGQTGSQAGTLLGVSVTNAAAAGVHTVEVVQTARAHKVSSDAVSSTTTALGFTNGDTIVLNGELAYRSALQASGSAEVGSAGTIAFTDPVTGQPIGAVDYAADTTLAQLASKITTEIDGVSAKVVTENGQARLEITSATRFTMAETGGGSALADLGIADRNTITLNAGDTLLDLRDRINNANTGANKIGVTASIISAGANEHYLVLTRDDTGAAMAIKDASGTALADLGVLKGDGTIKNQLQSAAKAQFYADGLLDLSNTKYESAVQGGAATQIGSSGTLSFTRDGDGGALGTVAYTAGMTLQQLADAITADIEGVTAKIVAEGNGARLVITGEDAFSIAETGGGSALPDLGVTNARRLIERGTNTVSDLWSGVTLNLFQAEKGTTVKIEIERDLAEVKTAIANFVDAYNNLRGFLNLQRSKPDDISGEQADAAGILLSSPALKEVDTMLGRILGGGALGVERSFSVLAQIGITFVDNNRLESPLLANTLTIDEGKLDETLLNNADEIRRLFAFDFSASDTRVSLLGFDRHTTFSPDGYTIEIDPADGNEVLVGEGGAKGLKLFHSGFEEPTTVHVNFTVGIAAQLNFAIARLVDETTGIIDSEKSVLADQNELSEKRIDEMLRRLDDQRQHMLDRFIRMETALATAQRILDSIKQTTEMMLASRQR